MPDAEWPQPEQRDVDPRSIVLAGAGLIILILFALALVRVAFGVPPRPASFGSGVSLTGGTRPLLQTDPQADLEAYRAGKDLALHSYGWIDPSHAITHVPIERAMETIVERGIPDWGQRKQAAEGECAILASVPRAPQMENCRPPAVGGER